MPKSAPRTPTLIFRLHPTDQIRLDELCRIEGKKRPELVREAVTWYLDNKDHLAEDMRQSKTEKRLKRMEDRLSGLLAKANLDLGTIVQILYLSMPKDDREAAFKKARRQSVLRLKQKLQEETELQELYKKDLAPPENPGEMAP